MLSLFAQDRPASELGKSLIAGGAADAPETGPVICACFGVRKAAIEAMIIAEPGCSVSDIGEKLKAGSNCGSCQPELRRMIGALAPA